MDKGESEESNGRDGEIRTHDLLTPSGIKVKNQRKLHLVLRLQTLVETVVLFNSVQHENWLGTQLGTQPIPRPAIP